MEKHSASYEFYKMMWDNGWTDEAQLRQAVVEEGNYSTANGITPSEFKEITGIDFEVKETTPTQQTTPVQPQQTTPVAQQVTPGQVQEQSQQVTQ